MYFALNKATDFFNSLGIHIWIIRVWQGHYVPIQYKDRGETRKKKKKKKGKKKNISVTFCILTSVLSVGQPGVQYLPSCVSNYLLRNWRKKVISLDDTSTKASDMPCRPSFIGSSFGFIKLDPGAQCIYLCRFLKSL